MLNEKQTDKVLKKLDRFLKSLKEHIFVKTDELQSVEKCQVAVSGSKPPEQPFEKAEKGDIWKGEGTYCWFRGTYSVPNRLVGTPLFVRPNIGGYEALLFVNGVPFGTFNNGEHHCDMIKLSPEKGEKIDIALEYYAGHYVCGTSPFETAPKGSYTYTYDGIDICVKDYEIQEFYFDLLALLQLTQVLPPDSFRRAKVIAGLTEVYYSVDMSFEDTPLEKITEALRGAKPVIKKLLSEKNSASAPSAAIIGHSHMDTAWLWHVGETVKKCARTYSNELNLMQQYPEYKFIQSSACHGDMMRKYYPELFKGIQKAVAEGKYEPNGGVWVECDCNITSGESMIRQFLWGQRFTRKYYNYTSNCFWLPDTFGYSAAIPQIMKGCCVDYFLTTKISWNDTNKFPYDTFYWQGIDGTRVFTHFNTIHHYPDVKDIHTRVDDELMQKSVNDKRLLAYGFGDGGGGPMFEMIEASRRCRDLEGCAKTEHMLVGDFMKKLEESSVEPNTYKGELYLELHRGTLTNQHTIKRNNRKAELALRDLEFFTVCRAIEDGKPADSKDIAPLYETLLMNQFHDILPGTCIHRAHEESREQTTRLIKKARADTAGLIRTENGNAVTLINTLSFERSDVLFLHLEAGYIVSGDYRQQRYVNLDGEDILMVAGVKIPAFSSVTLDVVKGDIKPRYAFFDNGNGVLETPVYTAHFADNGTIDTLFDKRAGRQIVKGENFNTLVAAEDVPASWDNWDVDADFEAKFKSVSNLESREIVSNGTVAYVVRSKYRISEKSSVLQDMVFFADSPEIRFDTLIDWHDSHRFLKAAFDTDVCDDFARHEIQFGYVKRPTTRNTTIEQAKFEVVNHKYSDISEPRYGVALLNDCKYGISARGGSLRLSLHKGGNRPDTEGDFGAHRCVYSVLPHASAFGAESVIKPAYMLNVPIVEAAGRGHFECLASVSADNCFIEAVKPCEDAERAFILRVYEAEGCRTAAELKLFNGAKRVVLANMLEEETEALDIENGIKLVFRPFEIKTIKVFY